MSDPLRRKPTTGVAGCCARRERPRSRAAEQRDKIAALQLVELHLIAGYRTGTFQRPDPPARNNGPGLAIMRRLRALARHDRNDASPPGGTQRVRWRVISPPGLSSRSSPTRRPSEAQFVVFSLKSFVQDLVGSRRKVFRMAIIAGATAVIQPSHQRIVSRPREWLKKC
jgi:hypothetical protein